MRVTRESLIRIASETAKECAYNDSQIVAAYLTGSLRRDEPMLGGTTDIDIVFVHASMPDQDRELVRLTPDFHLDIVHRSRDAYRSLRELRADPWLGHEMYDPQLLFEREKFFEFVQAGLRAGFEFEAPPLTLERCRTLYSQARRLWLELSEPAGPAPMEAQLRRYLHVIYLAANAIAELTGPPLAERRLLLEFPQRAAAAGRERMQAALFGLLGASQLQSGQLDRWLPDWRKDFEAAASSANADPRIHPARLNYYEKAIRAMLGSESSLAALWPLLQTWTLAANALHEEQLKAWQSACTDLELLGSGFSERTQGLDHFLDEIDLLLEEYGVANGLTASPLR